MNILKLSIISFSLLLSSNALSQSSQKNEDAVQILCVNKIDKREIFYDNNIGEWCDSTITNFCALSRQKAVRKVCSKVYKSRLAKIERNGKPEVVASPETVVDTQELEQSSDLEQEQMEIELKQIEIDQRKLDLRKQELDLLKQDQ